MNDQASLAFTYAAEGCKNWAAALTQFAGVFSALAENAKHASPDASLTIAINNNAAPKAAKGSTKARKQSLPAPPKDPKATPVLKSKKSAAPANKTTLVPAKPVVPAVESITAEEEDGDADGDARKVTPPPALPPPLHRANRKNRRRSRRKRPKKLMKKIPYRLERMTLK